MQKSIELKKDNFELFLLSFLTLFLEVTLIRWISTEIRIFAYFNNLVLLACFLGIGWGCFFPDEKPNLSITALLLAALLAMVKLPIMITVDNSKVHLFRDIPLLLSTFTDSVIWYEAGLRATFSKTLLGIAATLAVFFIILFIFIPLGQRLGYFLDRYKDTVKAYSINIGASFLGVWALALLSFIYSPPRVWFILISAMLFAMALLRAENRRNNLLAILICLLFIIPTIVLEKKSDKIQTVWSPYQKLSISPFRDKIRKINKGYLLQVNNVGYMGLLNLSENFIEKYPDYFDFETRKFSQYDLPYLFKGDAKDVLLLGAGAGNDAAGALRSEVKNVDAVEIDPGIYKLGLEFHPEEPYRDGRLKIVINDARSFLKKAEKKYDIVSLGLLDSHTLSSSYNNMRLDHYIYTKESFREAKNLLTKDGVFTVIFEPQRIWIAQRINGLLKETFGIPPVSFWVRSKGRFGWGGIMFVTGENIKNIKSAINSNLKLKKFISKNKVDFSKSKPVKLTTDNWPYLYLERPMIPRMHLSVIIILLLLFLTARKTILPGGGKINLHFFFLGAAFLLLEFQNISKTTLLFGSTWLVNAFTISAILLLILAANLFVSRIRIGNPNFYYFFLILSVLIIFLVPLRTFNFLGYWPKSILVSIFLNLPIFFAGIIFMHSLQNCRHKDAAFGSNLLGAAAGGILESISFVAGINMLLLIVIAFYSLSFLFRKERI